MQKECPKYRPLPPCDTYHTEKIRKYKDGSYTKCCYKKNIPNLLNNSIKKLNNKSINQKITKKINCPKNKPEPPCVIG